MEKVRGYWGPIFLLLLFNFRYYSGNWVLTFKESARHSLASVIYGLAFAFLFKWFSRKFLRQDVGWENFTKIAIWAAVVMALGESLRAYFAPH